MPFTFIYIFTPLHSLSPTLPDTTTDSLFTIQVYIAEAFFFCALVCLLVYFRFFFSISVSIWACKREFNTKYTVNVCMCVYVCKTYKYGFMYAYVRIKPTLITIGNPSIKLYTRWVCNMNSCCCRCVVVAVIIAFTWLMM